MCRGQFTELTLSTFSVLSNQSNTLGPFDSVKNMTPLELAHHL